MMHGPLGAASGRRETGSLSWPEAATAPMSDTDIYRAMFDNTGVGLYETTTDGRFVRANAALARMLGYPSPEALIAEVTDIGTQIYVDPAQRAEVVALLQRDGRVENFITHVRRRGGSSIWTSMTAQLIYGPDGAPSRFIGSAADVSDVIRTQEALRRAEENYRGIFENASEGIYWSTPDGRQLRANPALVRLNGYASEAELLARVHDIATEWYVDPKRRAEFMRLMEQDGRVENFESEVYRHKTRERIWVSENARLVRDADGNPSHYEGTVRDISSAKRAQRAMHAAIDEARLAGESKSAFLANMSHELRTPLNAIIGFCEMMMLETFGPLGDPRYSGYLKDVHFSANHLLQLIEDILDLSKAEARKIELDERPLDLEVATASAVRLLAERARRGNVAVALDFPVDLPVARADERRLRQILLNLLSNAVKFTPPGGSIKVSGRRREGGGVTLAVADTGIGIAAKDLHRVFQPFVQLHRNLQQEGTGLGLALCKKLVEAHGGAIALSSRPGEGTTVEVHLPPERVYAEGVTPALTSDALAALIGH
jgi:PAS domain S-box-containing protein